MPPTTKPTQTAKPVVVRFDVDETHVPRDHSPVNRVAAW